MVASEDIWNWGTRPTDAAEYEAMISSLDEHLAERGHRPFQRVLNAQRLISMQLGVSATLHGPERLKPARTPFGPVDLLLRVEEWYDQNYGERMRSPFLARSYATDIRGTLWRIHLPIVFGTITVVVDTDLSKDYRGGGFNILRAIDNFTQAYAYRIQPVELQRIIESSQIAFTAIEFLNGCSRHVLFDLARLDYEHSVDALMTGLSWSKASWEIAQCAEKLMKGLLSLAGHEYPRKGAEGHHIPKLGGLLAQKANIVLDGVDLETIYCNPNARYGEYEISAKVAYSAHLALMRLLKSLSDQLGQSEYA